MSLYDFCEHDVLPLFRAESTRRSSSLIYVPVQGVLHALKGAIAL